MDVGFYKDYRRALRIERSLVLGVDDKPLYEKIGPHRFDGEQRLPQVFLCSLKRNSNACLPQNP